jgi:hypothetical protein
VEDVLAGRVGGGSGCASTRPLGTEPVTSLAAGADRAAIGLENGLSVKRPTSALQPAAPAAIKARTAARA